jgi:hypothetical protein
MSETVTHRRTRQLKGQLTDLNLRNLTTRERPYKVADGNGLFVLVSPTGLRAWRWKYRFAAVRKCCREADAHRSAGTPSRIFVKMGTRASIRDGLSLPSAGA